VSRALYEQDVARRILALREDLVRHDENQAALDLMTRCVPFFLDGHQGIEEARERQRQMCLHLIDPDAYAAYYGTNIHERPFEEQYPGATVDNAHQVFHRVDFLRRGLGEQIIRGTNEPQVLDLAMNDGWMIANLAQAGYRCAGMDLNPDCVARAELRAGREAPGVMGHMVCDDALNAPEHWVPHTFDAVTAFEVVEHVADPDALLIVMRQMVKPNGRLYVSTPNGVDHGGDLPTWDHVEPKGHVRVYTPDTFLALLSRHGTVERIEQGPDRVMVAEFSV
jgi:2-polyprenyl-3-methyl-5-hydroxy-6-metoxy-1,4-benzoquinol methylase